MTLNVNGLNSKIDNGILLEQLKACDVIGLTETRSNTFDRNMLSEFDVITGNNGEELSGWRGLCLLTKKQLDAQEINNNGHGLWTKINNNGKLLSVGVYYIPHENSPYWHSELFDGILEDINEIECDEMIIMGDLNARTGLLDDQLSERRSGDEIQCRVNADQSVNNNGRQLIELCRTTEMLIANGRYGVESSKMTCHTANGSSVVDYILVSQGLLNDIEQLNVEDHNPALSDVHCVVRLNLKGDLKTMAHKNELQNRLKWNTDINLRFSEWFDSEEIERLRGRIQNTNNGLESEATKINRINEHITESIMAAATSVGAHRQVKEQRQNKHPWFDRECENRKREYKATCRRANGNREIKRVAYKAYKKFLNGKRKRYAENYNKKLLNAASNPRKFWKMLKKRKSNVTCSVPADEMYNHFKQLNENSRGEDENASGSGTSENDFINRPFTLEEVQLLISRIKEGKAPGADDINPEFVKNLPEVLQEIITDYFNKILETGVVPDEFGKAIICPVFKKGSKKDCGNYRGISLLNTMGKLFASLINERISAFMEATGALGEEQAGFREGHSTTDQIFILHTMIQLYVKNNKRLYCAFIDYEKAFDTINRQKLFLKLLKYEINGKILGVIKDLYTKTKACVKQQGSLSDYFTCSIGVRQGDNLSPLLFAIYTNDLEEHLRGVYDGLKFSAECIRVALETEDTETYLKLFLLLYADDTVIMAESECELRKALKGLEQYCSQWDLTINVKKTKTMIFSKGKARKVGKFTINGREVERVDHFNYLGVKFSYNGKFQNTMKHNIEKAKNALFKLNTYTNAHQINIQTKLFLFEKTIEPILLYGCEVWGQEDFAQIEIFHRSYLRKLIGIHKSAPSCMTYGEVGKTQLKYKIWRRMIGYWISNITADTKMTRTIMLFQNQYQNGALFDWIRKIREILNNCGLSYVHLYPEHVNRNELMKHLNEYLHDLAVQEWRTEMNVNRMCTIYRLHKQDLRMEPYLLQLSRQDARDISKFRCASPRLETVTAIYNNTIAVECRLCGSRCTPDEYHLVMKCELFEYARPEFLPRQLTEEPNIQKYTRLMQTNDRSIAKAVSRFLGYILATLGDISE
jgi:sorting nexin-29